ncbi:hypothetical protein [Brevibacterium aurantiacum]|uniref:hypothetical protein n=1 Tax=Brevibacterium aurantiacum TaxID=273384 RepID=UPI001D0382E8|nr:hypothetical protein [Brevibacterium aurantiacum]
MPIHRRLPDTQPVRHRSERHLPETDRHDRAADGRRIDRGWTPRPTRATCRTATTF